MIAVSNTAFEFLRQHKDVSEEIEKFVMKRVGGRLSSKEMLNAFENGISGEYGKIYSLDAQTLLGWIGKYQAAKQSSTHYLETGLLSVSHPIWDNIEWEKEANKCFTAFLNGVSESNFNIGVYDRMMIDGKIELNAYMEFFQETGNEAADVIRAKQAVLRKVFKEYKSKGWVSVYMIAK